MDTAIGCHCGNTFTIKITLNNIKQSTMGLVMPDIGLLFWMLVSFSIVLFILKKFAWKPILESLKEREDSIEESLNSAKKAKEEIAKMQASNEQLLKEARQERDQIVAEAKDLGEKFVKEAKNRASEEADKLIEKARQSIENEKSAAINEIKNTVASLSIEIAEKLLKSELSDKKKQQTLIDSSLQEINLN